MNTDNFEPLLEHIAIRIGLRARPSDKAEWTRAFKSRMSVHRIVRPQEYLQLLKSEATATDGEWRWLLPLLTNGESYFLRDEGQFSLLRNHLLPELIEKRRHQKSLRLWSAGCSTGEEPYSLAILIQELIPPNWNVSILGTDVNEDALQKARRGIYSAWSFRALPLKLRERFFQRVADGFQLDDTLRKMVRFERDNLSDNDKGQNAITVDMDLILCRNVLIYFQPDAVARVVTRFASSLREGGYLLTGHAELHHHKTAGLRVRTFPESIVYQCCEESQPLESTTGGRQIPISVSTPKPAVKAPISPRLPQRATLPVAPAPLRLQPTSKTVESITTTTVGELCEAARTHANAGRHDEAVNCCKEAIAIDPVATDAYFIWAQVAQEQGHLAAAKELYKKVIYLSPSHVEAHIELAAMYDIEADATRAQKMRQAALSALRSGGSSLTDAHVEEMKKQLERLLNEKSIGSRSR